MFVVVIIIICVCLSVYAKSSALLQSCALHVIHFSSVFLVKRWYFSCGCALLVRGVGGTQQTRLKDPAVEVRWSRLPIVLNVYSRDKTNTLTNHYYTKMPLDKFTKQSDWPIQQRLSLHFSSYDKVQQEPTNKKWDSRTWFSHLSTCIRNMSFNGMVSTLKRSKHFHQQTRGKWKKNRNWGAEGSRDCNCSGQSENGILIVRGSEWIHSIV